MKVPTALLLAASLLAAAPAACAGQEKPQAAPDFSVRDLQGAVHSLADYRGKVLFVNFWATWCPPCRAEIPDFIEAYGEHKGEGLEILGLSVDRLPAAKLADWVAGMKVNYPVALADQAVAEAFEPGGLIPTTIVIDPQGRVRFRHVGAMDKAQLLEYFRECLTSSPGA